MILLKTEGDEMKIKEKPKTSKKIDIEKKYKSKTKVNNKGLASVIDAKKQANYKDSAKVNNKSKIVAIEKEKKYKSIANAKDQEKQQDYKHTTDASEPKSLEVYGVENKLPIKPKELVEFFQMKSKIEDMLNWYETKHKNVIELPELKIDKKLLKGDVVVKTYRVNSIAVKEFEALCAKHKEFTTQNLLSQAIIEFVERYRK